MTSTGHTPAAHHTIRTVSIGTVWRLLRYPFILLSVSVIPRLMGDADYGRYALFMAVYLMLDTLTDIGSTQVFGRFVPPHEAEGRQEESRLLLFGYLLWATAPAVLLAAALPGLTVLGLLPSFPSGWYFLLGALLLLTRIEGTLFGFVYGLNQIGRYSAKEALRSALTFALVAALFVTKGLTGAFIGLALNEAVLVCVAVLWTRSRLAGRWPRVRWATFKPYLRFGLGFYLPTLLLSLMQRSVNVLIQVLNGSPQQVAYFDIANQYLLLMSTFLGLILATLLPSLAALHARGRHTAVDRYQSVVMTYSAVAVFVASNALGWFGRPAIARVLGPSFSPVFLNALLMTLAMGPSLVVYLGTNYALLHKQPMVLTRAVGAGLVALALVACRLIPRWGSLGGTLATVSGYLVAALVFHGAYRAAFRAVLPNFVWTFLLGLCFLPLYRFHFGWALAIPCYLLTLLLYLGILLGTGIISLADARGFLAAFRSAA